MSANLDNLIKELRAEITERKVLIRLLERLNRPSNRLSAQGRAKVSRAARKRWARVRAAKEAD